MSDKTRFGLDETRIPEAWYNVIPDLKTPLAPPKVVEPDGSELSMDQIGERLAAIFPMECVKQEMSPERWIDIPGAVIDVYKTYRPSPLLRAKALERALGLPAGIKIFYKYEGVSPAGSHKPNTAIPQAYYNKQEGITKLSTETGAGQWGSALSIAGALYGIDVEVFMVKVSYEQKPYRRILMETYGATVHPSPTNLTDAGRHVLAMDPDSTGSLGIAISEAVEVAVAGEVEQDDLVLARRLRSLRLVDGRQDRVTAFRRGQDALGTGELHGSREARGLIDRHRLDLAIVHEAAHERRIAVVA